MATTVALALVGARFLPARAEAAPPSPAPAVAAPRPTLQAAFLSAGGTGLFFGLNYELRPVPWLGVRGGAGFAPGGPGGLATLAALCGSAQGLFFEGPHRLELGVGITYHLGAAALLPTVGYRYEARWGLLLRGTLHAVIGPAGWAPWAGLAVGWHW